MSTILHPQSVVSVEEVLAYLQDQGNPTDDQNLLRIHINAVTALILQVTTRDRVIWIDDDTISEYKSGTGGNMLFLHNAPVRKIDQITLNPHSSLSTVITGPTEPATYNDDIEFDPVKGFVRLKRNVFPEGFSTSLIEYEAGYYPADNPNSGDAGDPEYHALKMIALDAIAGKWNRWKNQKHGVESESRGDSSITYSLADFNETAMHELRRYRRTLFA